MSGQTYAQRNAIEGEAEKVAFDIYDFCLRVAMPAIIQEFDPVTQTVTVIIAVSEYIRQLDGTIKPVEIKPLSKIPIVIPRAGGFSVTLPIKPGDECLVVFADTRIDYWWQWGADTGPNISREPMSYRRHDLNDGFAILGTWSQPNMIPGYSPISMQVRSDDGLTIIDIGETGVTVTAAGSVSVIAPAVSVNAGAVSVTGATTVSVTAPVTTVVSPTVNLSQAAGLNKLVDERFMALFNSPTHPDPVSGNTDVPVQKFILTNHATSKVKAL